MKKLLLCIVLLIQSVLVLAQPADSYIKSILDAGKIPGASMVVVKDGHWLYSRSMQCAYGQAEVIPAVVGFRHGHCHCCNAALGEGHFEP